MHASRHCCSQCRPCGFDAHFRFSPILEHMLNTVPRRRLSSGSYSAAPSRARSRAILNLRADGVAMRVQRMRAHAPRGPAATFSMWRFCGRLHSATGHSDKTPRDRQQSRYGGPYVGLRLRRAARCCADSKVLLSAPPIRPHIVEGWHAPCCQGRWTARANRSKPHSRAS